MEPAHDQPADSTRPTEASKAATAPQQPSGSRQQAAPGPQQGAGRAAAAAGDESAGVLQSAGSVTAMRRRLEAAGPLKVRLLLNVHKGCVSEHAALPNKTLAGPGRCQADAGRHSCAHSSTQKSI